MRTRKSVGLAQERPTATARFRHGRAELGVSRDGQLRPGGRLVVEYDPHRMLSGDDNPASTHNVLCHARFQPAGQTQTASMLEHPSMAATSRGELPRPITCDFVIPLATRAVELWFERRRGDGSVDWDSRYGQNYTFEVTGEGLATPARSLGTRPQAVVDSAAIAVVEDTAAKEHTAMGASGSRLRTLLTVRAVAGAAARSAATWADVEVFDATGQLIHAGSVTLESPRDSTDPALRVWQDEIYQGSGGGSGMGVWSRPNAQTIQYRLYSSVDGQVFTDGVLHQFEVPPDEDV